MRAPKWPHTRVHTASQRGPVATDPSLPSSTTFAAPLRRPQVPTSIQNKIILDADAVQSAVHTCCAQATAGAARTPIDGNNGVGPCERPSRWRTAVQCGPALLIPQSSPRIGTHARTASLHTHPRTHATQTQIGSAHAIDCLSPPPCDVRGPPCGLRRICVFCST